MSETSASIPSGKALGGLYHGVARYRGAVELGWYDFIARFRLSLIGPFWSPIQMALFVAVIVLILKNGLGGGTNYALYVVLGYYAWDFLSSALSEGATHFTAQASLIKNTPVNISYITVRKLSFLFCRSAMNAPIPLIAIFLYGGIVNINTAMLLPAVILYAFFMFSALTVFGVIGAYFRDFHHVMPTISRFLFFTTPIIWQGDAGVRKVISLYNPFSYFIELARAPLNGEIASADAWIVVSVLSLGGFAIALWVQSRFRSRLIYRL